jgi:uncharacterized RDD family membrane protein YckC
MDAPRIVQESFDARQFPAGAGPAGGDVRLGAFLIDCLLLAAFLIAVVSACTAVSLGPAGPRVRGMVEMSALILVTAGPLFYFVILECSPLQGTLGKYLIGIKVTDEAGARISPARSFARTLAKAAFGFACGLFMVNLIMVSLGKDRQAIHDLLAGTRVVPAGAAPPLPPTHRTEDTARAGLPAPPGEGVTPRDGFLG